MPEARPFALLYAPTPVKLYSISCTVTISSSHHPYKADLPLVSYGKNNINTVAAMKKLALT